MTQRTWTLKELMDARDLLDRIVAHHEAARGPGVQPAREHPKLRLLRREEGEEPASPAPVVRHRTSAEAPGTVTEATELVALAMEDRGWAKTTITNFVAVMKGLALFEPVLDQVQPKHLRARLARSTSRDYQRLMLSLMVEFFDVLKELGWWNARNPAGRIKLDQLPVAVCRTRLVHRNASSREEG